MPNFPWRPGGAVPPAGDGALDELLARGQLRQDAAAGLEPVAELLAALQAGPSNSELAGKIRALAEFRETFGMSQWPRLVRPRLVRARWVRPRRPGMPRPGPIKPGVRKPGLRRARLSSGLAAAAAVVVASGTAAAYVGALPASLQRVAHEAIAAPAAKPDGSTAARAGGGVGLATHGSTANDECAAYQHASAHGGATDREAAFRELAKTAHGAGNVKSFCASLSHPGAADSKPGPAATLLRPQPSSHSADKRQDHATHPRSDHPTGTHHDPPGGDRSGQPTPPGQQSARPPGQRAGHPHHFLHREALCGSPPGTQRPSHPHPSALSGQSRGC
jgi:hypothetical protein